MDPIQPGQRVFAGLAIPENLMHVHPLQVLGRVTISMGVLAVVMLIIILIVYLAARGAPTGYSIVTVFVILTAVCTLLQLPCLNSGPPDLCLS